MIPAANTTTGAAIAITDGRFFFGTMVVPSSVRLKFSGAVPPVITVAGRLEIQGEIDIAGATVPTTPNLTTGQPGAWRTAVANAPGQIGIASDGGNAFRFQLVFDRALASSLTIDRVVVVYQ